MTRTVLLTGATGQLGGQLLAELASMPDVELHVLARPDANGSSADERVRRLLPEAGAAFAPAKVTVHTGDLTQPGLGLAPAISCELRKSLTDIVHVAAHTALADSAGTGRAAPTNLDGTRALLDLCGPQTRFFHFSTAYVAGLCDRPFGEDDLDLGQAFRNDYERSKFAAEQALRSAFRECPALLTVVRPSIVVGARGSAAPAPDSSLYAVLALMCRAARRVSAGRLDFPYDPAAEPNYVPLDLVTAWTRAIFLEPNHWGRTYHLASEHPLSNREMGVLLEALLGIELAPLPPEAVARDRAARFFIRRAAPYLSYLQIHPRFTCDNRRRLPEGDVDFRIDESFLHAALAAVGHGEKRGAAAGGQRRALPEPARYFREFLAGHLDRPLLEGYDGLDATFAIRFRDCGQGWRVAIEKGRIVRIRLETQPEGVSVWYEVDVPVFLDIVSGRLAPQAAFFQRRTDIRGNLFLGMKLANVLGRFFAMFPYGNEE